ncbi:DUF308 domain-containing protein [Turicimonas muris]|uniref:DUF308 domain-containing protein n=1 Tax=Turicimonas muris TaxID=1796652 RepID=UPI0027299307|nr:DUF308 domain-containing protein [Turicimonas muris]
MATGAASKKTASKKSARSAKTTSRKTTKSTKSAVKAEPVVRRAKSVSWLAILESLIVGILGVLLLVNPEGVTKIIFYAVGIFLMIKGVYKIINYFAVHGKYDFYNNDLLYGIIALVFGVIAVVLWEQLGQVIGIVVGAWMIYGALVRMNAAIKMHTAGIKEWFYVLLLSMVMLALGIYMVITVGAVIAIVGWVMVASAVIGILDDLIFIRHLDAVAQ